MQNKIWETIRNILRKTILPLRRKREEWLSNFRFSMTFRISLSYIKLLLTHGLLFMIGFFLIFMYSEKAVYDKMVDNFVDLYKTTNMVECSNPYYAQGLSMKITDLSTGKRVYDDIGYLPTSKKAFVLGVHFNQKSKLHILVVKRERKFVKENIKYRAQFEYDLTGSYERFLALVWKMIILYLFIIFMIIRKGKRSDMKLFEPIRVMSATANRLTVNNLHSERLNVEGAKNELKDLASVINAMLDRIETSYESQKQFVSDASHELRTPIAVIQGYANLLNRWGTTNEEVLHESIDAIQNEARSMQDLVEKLLFLSRHDKKTLKLTKKRFNMGKLIEDMLKETKLVAGNRIITCTEMEDVIVYGDKQAIKQAIRIFIDNAVKYTHDGDEIIIKCQKVNEDCVVTIQDNGIGMTQQDIDHIFDRFYRSDYVRNQNISGHGLGLSLAKLIILAHTGKIKVRSQFKKGSSFIITLPKRRI